MIEPITQLALTLHHGKGRYALLIGSGVSRAAEIPTGWEVTLDLVRQVAAAAGQHELADLEAWFRDQYGRDPDYAQVLGMLAKTPAERQRLLQPYFESTTEDERARGAKQPTAAHRAIAHLVLNGYVRVLVTTNFDRLVEHALADVGVVPTVISTKEAAVGAMPLVHTACTVLKVHGDYLDAHIKNTPAELAKYDKPINQLLDQIFDQFGLIICGWSGEDDEALKAALRRCRSHRFSTYWMARDAIRPVQADLIALREAEVIHTAHADAFFTALEEKVTALARLDAPHPLSGRIAAESVKRYLEQRQDVRLRDLVVGELNTLASLLTEERFPINGGAGVERIEDVRARISQYEALTETLLMIVVTGCFWGDTAQGNLWTECIERLADVPLDRGGSHMLLALRRYPALLLLFGGGVAAIAGRHEATLADLVVRVQVREQAYGSTYPAALLLHPPAVLFVDWEPSRVFTPVAPGGGPVRSRYLAQLLRTRLAEAVGVPTRFDEHFDAFEYVLALSAVDGALQLPEHEDYYLSTAPLGRFAYSDQALERVRAWLDERRGNGIPIQTLLDAGMFGGDRDRFTVAQERLQEHVTHVREHTLL